MYLLYDFSMTFHVITPVTKLHIKTVVVNISSTKYSNDIPFERKDHLYIYTNWTILWSSFGLFCSIGCGRFALYAVYITKHAETSQIGKTDQNEAS